MMYQATFLTLGLLYLACTLATIQAVKYIGTEEVREGQPWSIECTGLKTGEKLEWTRNDQPIKELSSGNITVARPKEGSSKLVAIEAEQVHAGTYKCTPASNASFTLKIKSVATIKVMVNSTDIPLRLACDGYKTATNATFTWKKDKLDLNIAFPMSKDTLFNESVPGLLTLKEYNKSLYGEYECNTSTSANLTLIKVISAPVVQMQAGYSVVEGNDLNITCIVLGTLGTDYLPDVKIQWQYEERPIPDTDRILFHPQGQVEKSILTLTRAELADRGNWNCKAIYDSSDLNIYHQTNVTTFLRVKDKLAALWPFLGICAEVVVLCAIILIYEKKRNKAELDESDTDQSPDTKPTPNKDSDVRQRK